jgi:hypothetical protein
MATGRMATQLASCGTGLLLAVLLLGVSMSAQHAPKQFDLNGDVLGESVATFKARHPRAECTNNSETVMMCSQQDGISFAGFTGVPSRIGLFARFFQGRLNIISYQVGGFKAGNSILSVLTEKFGKPSKGEAIWETPASILSLTIEDTDKNNIQIVIIQIDCANRGCH